VVQQEEKCLLKWGREEGRDTFKGQREGFIPDQRSGGAQVPPCDRSWKITMNSGENAAEKEPGEWEGK